MKTLSLQKKPYALSHPLSPCTRPFLGFSLITIKEEKREAILVPKEKYSFTPEINIYDNKVVFMSLKERFALVIESEELTDALKKVFELACLGAKKYESEK